MRPRTTWAQRRAALAKIILPSNDALDAMRSRVPENDLGPFDRAVRAIKNEREKIFMVVEPLLASPDDVRPLTAVDLHMMYNVGPRSRAALLAAMKRAVPGLHLRCAVIAAYECGRHHGQWVNIED